MDSIEYLNKLIRIEEKIYEIYFCLSELEKQNQKNTFEYNSKLNELNDLFTIENNFLSQLPNDWDKIVDLETIFFLRGEQLEYEVDEIKRGYIDERIVGQLEILENNSEINDDYDYDDEIYYVEESVSPEQIEQEIQKRYGIEFYKRLQKRIENTEKDKNELIEEKYNMLFQFPLLGFDALCTGFNLKNMPVISNEEIAKTLEISLQDYELHYFSYAVETIGDILEACMWLEKTEEDENKKRTQFKILDIQLEISLSYLNFVNLCELKENLLKILELKGMRKSLSYILIKENFDEAIKYACNYPSKLATKPMIRKMSINYTNQTNQ